MEESRTEDVGSKENGTTAPVAAKKKSSQSKPSAPKSVRRKSKIPVPIKSVSKGSASSSRPLATSTQPTTSSSQPLAPTSGQSSSKKGFSLADAYKLKANNSALSMAAIIQQNTTSANKSEPPVTEGGRSLRSRDKKLNLSEKALQKGVTSSSRVLRPRE